MALALPSFSSQRAGLTGSLLAAVDDLVRATTVDLDAATSLRAELLAERAARMEAERRCAEAKEAKEALQRECNDAKAYAAELTRRLEVRTGACVCQLRFASVQFSARLAILCPPRVSGTAHRAHSLASGN